MDRIICKIMEEPTSVLIKLRENGVIKHWRVPFRNYFYVLDDDYELIESEMRRYVFTTQKVIDANKRIYRKLILSDNTKRNFAKKFCEEDVCILTFEADIDSAKRFLIDNPDLELNQEKMSVVWMDIETYDLHPFKKDQEGRIIGDAPILSFALKNQQGEVFYRYNKAIDDPFFEEYVRLWMDFIANRSQKNYQVTMEWESLWMPQLLLYEKELLIEYLSLIKDYDIVVAYNGSKFDYLYLKDRCTFHKLKYDAAMTNDLDQMIIVKKHKIERLKSYSLQNLALHEFKNEVGNTQSVYKNIDEVSKVDWKQKTGCKKIFELYMTNPDVLEEYNIQDVHLMEMIEKKLNYLPINFVHAKMARCPITDTMNNSRICDYLLLNEYKKDRMIVQSKPTKSVVTAREDEIKGDHLPGGFTTVLKSGLHGETITFDFKSRYPTLIVEHNISPETYVKSVMPNLENVFSQNERDFLDKVFSMWREFLNKKGKLKESAYNQKIEELKQQYGIKKTMDEFMWEFVQKYYTKDTVSLEELQQNQWTMTPADMNRDRVGWRLHPHHVFRVGEGVLPRITKKVLTERDKIKYELKKMEKGSELYMRMDSEQNADKTIGNSAYGFISMKSGRFYRYELANAITSGSRFKLKKTILFCRTFGFDTTHSDTDSCYLIRLFGDMSIIELSEKLFEYFDELNAPYNSCCNMMLKNPKTGEFVTKKHFTVFEHEKTLASCIVVKKKRYYFKQILSKDKVIYDSRGGFFIKNDTIPIASEWQKALVKDILDGTFDAQLWKKKILSLKNDVFSQKLPITSLVKVASVSKPLDQYGQSVIDGNTGVAKIKKDGTEQKGSVPPHIMIARRMQEAGEEIYVGDKISYVVTQSSPKIDGVHVDLFTSGIAQYDERYYWKCIITPLLEILRVTYPKEVYSLFVECWGFTPVVLERLIAEQEEEDEIEEGEMDE